MHGGLLLVPLTARFAFISPSLLVIVMPLLALLPGALLLTARRHAMRRAAERLRPLQSGHLNVYLALIGLLLVAILGLALLSAGG